MSKEYKWKTKTYIAVPELILGKCNGCAFFGKPCHKFQDANHIHTCVNTGKIFIEKTASVTKEINDKSVESIKVNVNPPKLAMSNDSVLQYCKETSWGVNPANNVEIRTDRAIPDKIAAENTWSFQLKMDNGYRPASISVTASKTAENCKFTAAILPDTERFIACLIENGKLAPAESPKQHKTRESAEKEAERLCKLYHQEFAVLRVVSAVKPQEPKKEVFA